MGISQAQAAIVTSIRPLGFIASAVADQVIPVEVILPDGASPHDYSLRPSDIVRIKKSDLLLWVGPELEGFLKSIVLSWTDSKCITLIKSPSITTLLIKHGDIEQKAMSIPPIVHPGEYNMHIWLSPEISRRIAELIYHYLIQLMPEKKQQLDSNLNRYNNFLTKTDANIAKRLSSVRGQKYYVYHDSCEYFEKYYGLTPVGYFTINPQLQPGARILNRIRRQLLEKKVSCIFYEKNIGSLSFLRSLIRGTEVRIGPVDPLGIGISLTKDSYHQFLSKLSQQYIDCLGTGVISQ